MIDRVLLDANALLNATFVEGSWSSLVVHKLRQRGSSIFVGSRSLGEARASARSIAERHRKRRDPDGVIEQFIGSVAAVEVPPSADAVEATIPVHDHHVVQEAITAAASILTSDASLWAGCRASGRPVLWPLQAMRHLDGLGIGNTVFGVAPGVDRGSLFARVAPGGWAGAKDIGQFTVADCAGRLWLRYCTGTGAWLVDLDGVGTVSLPVPLRPAALNIVAVSWRAGKALQLRSDAVGHPASLVMPRPLATPITGNVAVGHRSGGTQHWNGAINVCVISDRSISKELWAIFRGSDELTPNPYDDDRLAESIRVRLA